MPCCPSIGTRAGAPLPVKEKRMLSVSLKVRRSSRPFCTSGLVVARETESELASLCGGGGASRSSPMRVTSLLPLPMPITFFSFGFRFSGLVGSGVVFFVFGNPRVLLVTNPRIK